MKPRTVTEALRAAINRIMSIERCENRRTHPCKSCDAQLRAIREDLTAFAILETEPQP